MRTITRFVAAILAAIGLSAPLVAVPAAASWSDFTSLTSGNYRLTADEACSVTGGVMTLGGTGLTLALASPLGEITVIMEVSNVPTEATLIDLKLASGNHVSLYQNANSGLEQWWDADIYTNNQTTGAGTWDKTKRQVVAFTYKPGNAYGTHTYVNGELLYGNLKLHTTTNGNVAQVRIGSYDGTTQSATGMKVYGIYLFTSKLAEADVASETAAVAAKRRADVSGAANWSGLTWDPSAPTSSDSAVLQVAKGKHTLTLGNDDAISLSRLFTQGEGSLAFAGSGSLSSTTTSIATDTDVSAITANLGAVTVAAGKTLTMRNLVFSSITSTGGALCFKGGTVSSALLQTFNGAMTLRDDANVTLPNQYTMTSKQRFIADSGNATLKLYNNDEADGEVDLDEDETIQVKAGATLTLKARDLGGWRGYRGANLAVAVRGKDSKITASNYDSNPGCFVGRVVLADGGEIAGGSTNTASLNFYGDTSTNAAYPEIYVSSGTGTWSGNLWRNKGIVVKVADGATFVLSGTLKSEKANNKAIKKIGAGEMKFTTAQTEYTGALTIADGQVTVSDAGMLGTGAVTVNEGKTLEVQVAKAVTKTIANTISGTGTVKKSGAGTLTLTGTLPTSVEVAEGTLDLHSANFGDTQPSFAVASDATLILPAGKEGTMEVPEGATLALVLSPEQLALAYVSHTTGTGTIAFKKVENGTLTDVTEADGNVVGGTFTAPLNTWTAPETGEATWANSACWSLGLPSEGDAVRVLVSAADTTLTVGKSATVAKLLVAGPGSLKLAGEAALTVTESATFLADTSAAKSKLLVANTIQIDSGVTLTLSSDATEASPTINPDPVGTTSPFALPALTGGGTLAKEGSGYVALFTTVAEPTIHVKSGALFLRATSNDTLQNNNALTVEVDDGATLKFAGWSTSFTNSLNSFKLKGGSKTILGNGIGGGETQIAGTITVTDASDENPARIYGSAFGTVTLATAITGEGTLEFANGEAFNGNYPCNNQVTVSGNISGSLKIRNSDTENIVKFEGANTYTGGTEIAAGAPLMVNQFGNLGSSGAINVLGNLKFSALLQIVENRFAPRRPTL